MLPEPNPSATTLGARTFESKDALMDTVMELEIGPGPQPGSYVVHVLRSVGGGEPTQTITLDLDELVARRPLLEATVLSSSVSARRVMSDTEAAVQDVGRRLFDATFSGEVRSAYRTSMAVASERGKSVQIALRLTAPGLAALPWEALYDAEIGTYLCRKEPLVRHVPAPYSPAALAIAPPMRVLGMISSPRGLPALDVGAERERLEEALRPHLDSGRVELKWLDEVTWTGVHRKLLEEQWHVLHFVGHGTYDVETDEGVLAFVGRDGRADYVTASSLADLLDEAEPTPRLVVLNSCQSGAGSTTDLFSGTAAALAHSGIRAVAAMQFSISDTAAIEFARGFYTALAHGRGIDEAVRSGRIGILGMGRGTLEWVTPVLYLRGEEAQLFDVAPMPPAKHEVTGPVARPIPIVHTGPLPDSSAHSAPPKVAFTDAAPKPEPAATVPTPPGPRAPAPAAQIPSVPRAPTLGAPTPPASTPSPAASAPAPHPRRSNRKPWLVVGIVAVLAVGAAVTAVFTLNPDILGTSGSSGSDGSASTTTELDVPMNEAAVSTGVSCAAGDTLEITASGQAWHDATEGSLVGPDGLTGGEVPEARVFADANTASIIGALDSTNEPFYVGNAATYVCPADGTLYLGINDTHLEGNHGSFQVQVTHTSAE